MSEVSAPLPPSHPTATPPRARYAHPWQEMASSVARRRHPRRSTKFSAPPLAQASRIFGFRRPQARCTATLMPIKLNVLFTYHFWNLEQSSTEKAGIQPTYHEPFQEVVTSPLPTPLGAEQTWFFTAPAFGRGRVSGRAVQPRPPMSGVVGFLLHMPIQCGRHEGQAATSLAAYPVSSRGF